VFYFDTTGKGQGASSYWQAEVEVPSSPFGLDWHLGQGGGWLFFTSGQGWEFWLFR